LPGRVAIVDKPQTKCKNQTGEVGGFWWKSAASPVKIIAHCLKNSPQKPGSIGVSPAETIAKARYNGGLVRNEIISIILYLALGRAEGDKYRHADAENPNRNSTTECPKSSAPILDFWLKI
jgi:hypothetical protein